MGLEIVRRMSRYTWLRLLVTLAIYMIAVPGTVRSNAFGGVAAAKVPAQSDPMERELKHEQRDITDDQVRVFYCTTCGFQQNFLEFKTYLEERYPHLADRVYGENYEVDPMKKVRVKQTFWCVLYWDSAIATHANKHILLRGYDSSLLSYLPEPLDTSRSSRWSSWSLENTCVFARLCSSKLLTFWG